jgi:hypothetical protein
MKEWFAVNKKKREISHMRHTPNKTLTQLIPMRPSPAPRFRFSCLVSCQSPCVIQVGCRASSSLTQESSARLQGRAKILAQLGLSNSVNSENPQNKQLVIQNSVVEYLKPHQTF